MLGEGDIALDGQSRRVRRHGWVRRWVRWLDENEVSHPVPSVVVDCDIFGTSGEDFLADQTWGITAMVLPDLVAHLAVVVQQVLDEAPSWDVRAEARPEPLEVRLPAAPRPPNTRLALQPREQRAA